MNFKKWWKKARRGIKYPILVFLIKSFVLVVRLVPRKAVLAFCRAVGQLAFTMARSNRKKTVKNLSHIYGNKLSQVEIKDLARSVFVHQAMNFGDYIKTLHCTTREGFAGIIDIEGEEHLKAAYEQGRGVICLMSHTGSWEFSAIILPVMGYSTSALSRPLPNPRIDKLIVEARQRRGMKNISRGKAYPKLIDAINSGDCLIIMIDQDTTAPSVFVDFLGRRAYTPVGAARLALDTKAPVVPMFMRRKADNTHQFTILPPVDLIDTGDRENDLLENTRVYSNIISDFIDKYPDQWVWMHERWKTTPESQKLFVEKLEAKKRAEKERLLKEGHK